MCKRREYGWKSLKLHTEYREREIIWSTNKEFYLREYPIIFYSFEFRISFQCHWTWFFDFKGANLCIPQINYESINNTFYIYHHRREIRLYYKMKEWIPLATERKKKHVYIQNRESIHTCMRIYLFIFVWNLASLQRISIQSFFYLNKICTGIAWNILCEMS